METFSVQHFSNVYKQRTCQNHYLACFGK